MLRTQHGLCFVQHTARTSFPAHSTDFILSSTQHGLRSVQDFFVSSSTQHGLLLFVQHTTRALLFVQHTARKKSLLQSHVVTSLWCSHSTRPPRTSAPRSQKVTLCSLERWLNQPPGRGHHSTPGPAAHPRPGRERTPSEGAGAPQRTPPRQGRLLMETSHEPGKAGRLRYDVVNSFIAAPLTHNTRT